MSYIDNIIGSMIRIEENYQNQKSNKITEIKDALYLLYHIRGVHNNFDRVFKHWNKVFDNVATYKVEYEYDTFSKEFIDTDDPYYILIHYPNREDQKLFISMFEKIGDFTIECEESPDESECYFYLVPKKFILTYSSAMDFIIKIQESQESQESQKS